MATQRVAWAGKQSQTFPEPVVLRLHRNEVAGGVLIGGTAPEVSDRLQRDNCVPQDVELVPGFLPRQRLPEGKGLVSLLKAANVPRAR